MRLLSTSALEWTHLARLFLLHIAHCKTVYLISTSPWSHILWVLIRDFTRFLSFSLSWCVWHYWWDTAFPPQLLLCTGTKHDSHNDIISHVWDQLQHLASLIPRVACCSMVISFPTPTGLVFSFVFGSSPPGAHYIIIVFLQKQIGRPWGWCSSALTVHGSSSAMIYLITVPYLWARLITPVKDRANTHCVWELQLQHSCAPDVMCMQPCVWSIWRIQSSVLSMRWG